MLFEWDENKSRLNKRKHGLSFELASLVFLSDSFLLSVLDERHGYSEERWQSIGLVGDVLICVAHTVEEDKNDEEIIRIISARTATPGEARRYYANRKNG
jgi:uncharacterized DUF497 family protein